MQKTKSCEAAGCTSPHVALGLCRSHYKKQYRLKNHARLIEQERQQLARNRDAARARCQTFKYSNKGRYHYMVRDASRRGLDCSINFTDYNTLLSAPCYYCEKPLPKSMGTGLDRIDNSKGYTPGNVLSCCGDCNVLRMNKLTVRETKILSMTLRSLRDGTYEG